MAEKSDKGTCRLCESTYTGKGIIRHLSVCLSRSLKNPLKHTDIEAASFFHLQIKGRDFPQYWLHLMVDMKLKLDDLDRFLRDTWLECCGHLSAFFYRGHYMDMDIRLCDIFRPGMMLLHCYDFGKATELVVRVIAAYEGTVNGWHPIHILARNKAPKIVCSVCGRSLAVKICTVCLKEGKGWLCETCAAAHPCGEEIILPVLNSPRTGICGYDGKLIN